MGIRRYQTREGILTPLGRERLGRANARYNIMNEYAYRHDNSRQNIPKSSKAFNKVAKSQKPKSKNLSDFLGFDERKHWQSEQHYADRYGAPGTRVEGMMEQYVNDLYNLEGRQDLTEEEQQRLEKARKMVKFFTEELKKRQKLADQALKEYANTPIGAIETTYNSVVKAGESAIDSIGKSIGDAASSVGNFFDQAASDVGKFFKKLF